MGPFGPVRRGADAAASRRWRTAICEAARRRRGAVLERLHGRDRVCRCAGVSQWFQALFVAAISKAEKAQTPEARLDVLNTFFTYYVYVNVCRSVTQREKLQLELRRSMACRSTASS